MPASLPTSGQTVAQTSGQTSARTALLAGLLGALACVQPPSSSQAQAEAQTAERAAAPDPEGAAAPEREAGPSIERPPALQAQLDAALAAKGPDYEPRTEHLRADGSPTYTNRLILETSPYLLQHAHNPVDWHAWGDEAFAKARAEAKPVLLSVGYSTCHWCHVMERESFEDEAIAAYINENYVAIKVDREQRPDVDEIYMRAVQILSGRGGWPMTVILTPAREPFFGGTYFPPRDAGKRPGFRTVLEQMREVYDEQPEAVVAKARELSQAIAARSGPAASEGLPPASLIADAAAALGRSYDATHGGFGNAPKFPRPVELELLLRHAQRSDDAGALAWVRGTVDGMTAGGLRDRVGGGFHRYSTDAAWLVPHFEKMLYDNAQLAVVLLELVQVTGDPRYAAVARETLTYLTREMSAPAGGFYSATDADSLDVETGESEEGLFFTWSRAELAALLDASQLALVNAYYQPTAAGNFEGRNILQARAPLAEVAAELELDPRAAAETLAAAHRTLYAARARRTPPLRDDKILTAWNGLAISAFARAAWVLDEPAYLERARQCAEFLAGQHVDAEGRLLRSTLDGQASGRAFLDDYAFLIQGYLDLFEVSAASQWLERALALQAQLDGHYLDAERGGYFMTADDGEALLTRTKPSYDGAEPSGNAVAALNLLRLHAWTLETPFQARAEQLLTALGGEAARNPIGVPKLLTALDFARARVLQIFVVAPPGEQPPAELLAVIRQAFVPNRVRTIIGEHELPVLQGLVPALGMKMPLGGEATAYVCEDNVCQAPTRDPAVLAEQLARLARAP